MSSVLSSFALLVMNDVVHCLVWQWEWFWCWLYSY